MVALNLLNFIKKKDDVFVVLMIFLQDPTQKCIHFPVEDMRVKILALSSPGIPRIWNPIGYFFLDFQIRVSLEVFSGQGF